MITNILFKKWQKVYKKHLTSTALCGIINITKGEESPKKRKEVIKNERSKILVSRRQHDVR